MKKFNITILFFILSATALFAQQAEYLQVKPESGDGIEKLLTRYNLPFNDEYFNSFKELNQGKLTSYDGLHLTKTYSMPIKVYKFNDINIRSTLGIKDYDVALAIQHYNEELTKSGVKTGDFRDTKELWVPIHGMDEIPDFKKTKIVDIPVEKEYPIFGEKYSKVKQTDFKLKDRVFYIVSGHGGPDPGAIGQKQGYDLHEDEYAYDVSLRLARNLLLHGAKVYIIVRDDDDGIRDEVYLNNSNDEFYLGGSTIDANQRARLQKRAAIINELYQKNKATAKSQNVIVTHVDSRYVQKRIDIFFYYKNGSKNGKKLAKTLLTTIEKKYRKAQPGRGYDGTTSTRNLYMLNNCLPECTYIEIGNIQNPLDQKRILVNDNRQAIANWLTDGLLKYYN